MKTKSNNSSPRNRKSKGRRRLFDTPDDLWKAACNYFEWVDANPWKQTKEKCNSEQQTELIEIERQTPFSLIGFCIYVGACASWWRNFRKRCHEANDEEFSDVITRIENIIETQQFEGACVGAFNANIIARKLGLSDKQEVTGKEFKGFNFLPYIPETKSESSV